MSLLSMSQVAWVSLDQVTVTETNVPVVFTDEDILQFIVLEQAQLFPMLDQDIYFDFLIQNSDKENKRIRIVACNKKIFSDLAETVLFLKIDHKDFAVFNLLPWRQREIRQAKKKELKILAVVVVCVSVFMLVVSFFYLHIAQQDKEKSKILAQRKKVVLSKLVRLEKSNQEIQTLVLHWKNRIDAAYRQSTVEKLLLIAEAQRPTNLVLEKMQWKEGVLLINGKSKEVEAIKVYINHLALNAVKAQLKFMGNSSDLEFPVQFQVEMKGFSL